MEVKLGGTFLTCAMGPLHQAGVSIQASRMPEGLHELAPAGLLGGFRRGVEQAAKLAGVRVEDVERLLPMDEVREAILRLEESHSEAVVAWNVHAGRLGGMLQGVAEVTNHGTGPDVGMCLERLASKVRRDGPFSEPLQVLAEDVVHWQATLARCRKLLDEGGGGALEKAYRRRRLRRLATVVISGLVIVAALAVIARVHMARARIDALLGQPAVCAVRGISEGDLDRATSEQQRRVAARIEACAAVEAREAREREARERAEEKARQEQRRREERDAKCAAFAVRFKAGAFSAEDEAISGVSGELLRRIAQRRLTAADVGPSGPALPCDGARGGDELRAAFADALVASVWTWGPAADPGPRLGEVLAPRRADLTPRARTMLSVRAIDEAKRAIVSGNPAALGRASRLCALTAALDIASGNACAALEKVTAKRSP
ncbi:hypothetical protein SOCEGT47_040020 [Sorangium cellulosum]|uniref:Uncharacterized protein n=1 Tax=Sorangium cellulosum TaxID=56 RepID=A0A4P2Q3A5_SORCE|nr:hypothetical protein [Sorangium cellulosum]AUX23476.1 hypothetical protein SOCEGT47_040020 [Sorangium cellulosum]